ncbi:MAG TPA: biotin--[acetyl-CoA-carboxylase] ligase [Acidiferrobacter sp.]|nr:biotin--[acetyl-CoA-carboxylase] ligase [Acidiferrobacter sp.]
MGLIHDVLKILADGEQHSGVALAERLSVTRAAISKAVAGLTDVPITVDRKGYALPTAFRPLDEARITRFLGDCGCALDHLWVLAEVDSTNRFLLAAQHHGVCACLAERQTAGRGRRGRAWQATPYGNVMLSVGLTLRGMAEPPGVLSLGAGVAVARVLRTLGVQDTALKWPNDVLWQARKLAGVLIEMRGEPEAMRVVVGVGLNGTMGQKAAAAIDQPWVDLRGILPTVDRDYIAALLIAEILAVMADYRRGATGAILDEWRAHHALAGVRVSVHTTAEIAPCIGVIQDINEEGALMLTVAGETRVVRSGEVSVRPL